MKLIIKYLVPIAYFLLPFFSFSQINLVPNYSFEAYNACPWTLGEIYKAPPWFQASTNLPISTDFFHTCSSFQAGVPSNYCGYQFPKSSSGYAGFIVYNKVPSAQFPNPYREYLETQLTDSLIAGKEYCVEFYLSLAERFNIITDAVGAYFSKDSIISTDYLNLQYTPQIQNASGNLLNDSTGWMKISGSFVATGGEKFITIGNFKDDLNTYADTLSTNAPCSYFYIDDISVKEMIPVTAEAGINKSICIADSTLLGDPIFDPTYEYSWSPSQGLSNTNIPQPFAKPTNTTTYYLTVTDSAVSCNLPAIDSVTVTVLPNIAVNAGSDVTIMLGTNTTLTGLAIAGSTFNWSPSAYLSCDTCSLVVASPTSTTTYVLTASLNSCSSSDTVTVYVDTDCGELFVPNVFSPNGDGANDFLNVFGNCITAIDLIIFDRWGEKVFESTDINTGWDGTYKGTKLADAVFVYILTATVNEKKVEKHGNVSLLR